MKNQYVRLFSFLFGLTFIISGVIFTFTRVYKEAKAKEKEKESVIVDEIGSVYDKFYEKYSDIESYRDGLLDEILEYTSYFSNMTEGYEDMMKKITSYETMITELEDMSSYLNENCEMKYSSSSANNSCDYYYKYLEKTINLFLGDKNFFNQKIKEYNEWIIEENESEFIKTKYEELKEFESSKYTEYVDLNKDKTYLGMNAD
jgi:hypothetical protein